MIQEVGVGTFGRVLECLNTKTDKKVAIKVVRRIRKYTESAAIEADILRDVNKESVKRDNALCGAYVRACVSVHYGTRRRRRLA